MTLMNSPSPPRKPDVRCRRTRAGAFLSGLLLAALVLAVPRALAGTGAPSDTLFTEQRVKAAFLYNFAKFVTWPAGAATAGPADSLIIGAVEAGAVGDVLRSSVQGRSARGRPVGVHIFRRVEDVGPCQILYAGETDPAVLAGLLRERGWRGVLTVGETDRFLQLGGTIRFQVRDNRVGFVVNVSAVAQNALEINSGMLKVAQSVITTPPQGGK